MIITLNANATKTELQEVVDKASRFPQVKPKTYDFSGTDYTFVEVHLIGDTAKVPTSAFDEMPQVRRVVRVSEKYRLIGRHGQLDAESGFDYNGLRFDGSCTHLFAGLCAVDTPEHVEQMFAALQQHGLTTTRMGAYKPRTSPYDFQGLGEECLPWVFELANQYGIRLIAMEVCDAKHIEQIHNALAKSGPTTKVMLQVGTRNAQNFELLKEVGRQKELPVLFKRGMGITLEESLNACEYVASEGQPNIVFCLRGVKSHLGDPHRNLVDFAHVPAVRIMTRLPLCIDPSHSVGRQVVAPDGLTEVFHVTGQGVIVGASMILVDFHPDPKAALCDGPQALLLDQLPRLKAYVDTVRTAYDAAIQL